ncbi:hypothetical protein Tco_0726361 [Tanacetum coccineum]|uniref:Uncharacterized protein n=1 Tax=Tanacetum coccineum TaxID=301880 RepID=A0ABQ4YHN2_9ASTR
MRLVRKIWWVGWRTKVMSDVEEHVVNLVSKHLDFMPSGATTLRKHVVEALSVFKLRRIVVNVDKQWLRWIHNTIMKRGPSKWDNGLRVCLEEVFVETSQDHIEWHRSIAFILDFIHSIENHGGEVEFSFDEFVGVSLELVLSGSRNGDVPFDKVMLRTKETTIRMIIKHRYGVSSLMDTAYCFVNTPYVGIKSLLNAASITAAHIRVNAAYLFNAAEGVNAASEEVSTAELLKFNFIKDAKLLLEAVEKRFGRNAATKKTQRNLLKQQYENFTAPSSEMLDQTFDRLQKLVSQLELLDEKLSQEDVNQKLLRSLSPE